MFNRLAAVVLAASACFPVSSTAKAGEGLGLFSALFDPDAQTQAATPAPLGPEVKSTREIVAAPAGYTSGSILVDTPNKFVYYILHDGTAARYAVGVPRIGFEWKGKMTVGRKSEWPVWTPPADMIKRRPDLPKHMAGGPDNPLGARAMYLYSGRRDSGFRIHGTNEAATIGQSVSSGCIRMLNADVIDLYGRVKVGAKVDVL